LIYLGAEVRTFRVDHVRGCSPDSGVPFVRVDDEEIAAYTRGSVDGFHGPGKDPIACRFTVRDPEARWVEHNLLAPMQARRVDGGIEVTIVTYAVDRWRASSWGWAKPRS
jgi:hypothetical protein